MTAPRSIPELLQHLEQHRGSFPEELAAEAISRRDEIIPHLLNVLDEASGDPLAYAARSDTMLHTWAMYLLALFRETRAYPLLVKALSAPGDIPFDLAGDVVTQNLGGILASVSGGDVSGIKTLIEDSAANEYVRGSAMDALVVLWACGRLKRAEVMAYFLELFKKLERTRGMVWNSLANACADLWPKEAMEELRLAYDEGLIDPGCIAWDDVEMELARGPEVALDRLRDHDRLINNLARQMGWMMAFQEDRHGGGRGEECEPDFFPEIHFVETYRRPEPKVGRNDHCPCGSGKKFKKCCASK